MGIHVLEKEESTPCHPSVRASSWCLGGCLIPGAMVQGEGFRPAHYAGQLALDRTDNEHF